MEKSLRSGRNVLCVLKYQAKKKLRPPIGKKSLDKAKDKFAKSR